MGGPFFWRLRIEIAPAAYLMTYPAIFAAWSCFDTCSPRWPHLLRRMRGPNAGAAMSSGQSSTLTVVWWPQAVQVTSSERGPGLRVPADTRIKPAIQNLRHRARSLAYVTIALRAAAPTYC
jgi:hypothetical protein